MLTLISGGAYLIFRSPKVQTIVVQWVAKQLSHSLDAKISVGGVNISLFKSIVLEKVMIEDQNEDTLFFISNVKCEITIQYKVVNYS